MAVKNGTYWKPPTPRRKIRWGIVLEWVTPEKAVAGLKDVTSYAGQEILLRFQYITDDAVNGAGLCLRRISVPGVQPDPITNGWAANGFILIDNRVAQDYIVQVIEMDEQNRVSVMKLDGSNDGEVSINAPQELNRLVVAVAALAPKTLQPATYTISAAPSE